MTHQKGQYLYLYLLLDEWSRKIIQWRIAWAHTAEESRWLLEAGLTDQNILDLPEDQRPETINDRGRQMKAKPIQRLCEDHGMPQLFSRPRTPNDNPCIESAFSTAKRAPEYPGRFLDDREAVTYFTRYFHWTTQSITTRESTSSPRSKPTTAKGRPSWRSDGPKPSPSAAGAGKNTKRNPACKKPRNKEHRPASTP